MERKNICCLVKYTDKEHDVRGLTKKYKTFQLSSKSFVYELIQGFEKVASRSSSKISYVRFLTIVC